jgi:hypothetical protein
VSVTGPSRKCGGTPDGRVLRNPATS